MMDTRPNKGSIVDLVTIKLSDIERYENSRGEEQDVSALMASIKQDGLISPLVVCPNFRTGSKKNYLLVAGNRRFAAIEKLGFKTVDCFINDNIKDQKSLMLINLSENIQRENTSPWEEGRYMTILIDTFKMNIKEVAVRLSVTQSYVERALDTFKRTPKKYAEKIVYSANRNVPGKLNVSTSSQINAIASQAKFNVQEKERMYEAALKENLTWNDMREIGRFIAKGIPVDKALKIKHNITHMRLDVTANRAALAALKTKHNLRTNADLVEGILRGTIKDVIPNPVDEVYSGHVKEIVKDEKNGQVVTKRKYKLRKKA